MIKHLFRQKSGKLLVNHLMSSFSITLCTLLLGLSSPAAASNPDKAAGENPVPLSKDGTGAYFGANYSAPFAYSFRALNKAGVDIKTAIDADVAHMSRLGLNGYRVHIWDREIANESGHLLDNKHLDALDYLLFRLKENDIQVILTTIAWWPPGYPEPNPVGNSFSDRFSREEMVGSAEAIAALKTYIGELIPHLNPYTGARYFEDTNIIAVELFNEPKHSRVSAEQTTTFINELAGAARAAGFTRSLFYNISEEGPDLQHGEAVCRANIQGVSFQWYPTGLTRGAGITANVLPNVEIYIDPFRAIPSCRDKVRMIYEFDAADVASSTMYPAMAASLKKAGFRWASMFSYDPMHLAHSNTEYYTHYLNLVYTPRKAIGMLIASQLFRDRQPGSGTKRLAVDFENNLAEYASETLYLHTSTTDMKPVSLEKLTAIAAVGSSPLVHYPGNGTYFLDRKQQGLWELEVYPDIVEIADPFDPSNLGKTVRRPVWRTWDMTLTMADLGTSFFIIKTSGSLDKQGRAENGRFRVSPGTYTLSVFENPETAPHRDFYAPTGWSGLAGVQHQEISEIPDSSDLAISAQVFSSLEPESVTLHARRLGQRRFQSLPMQHLGGKLYGARILKHSTLHAPGIVEYVISAAMAGQSRTYPGDIEGSPDDWNYSGRNFWRTRIVNPGAPLPVFDAERDSGAILYPHTWAYGKYAVDFTEGRRPGEMAMLIDIQNLGPGEQAVALRSQFDATAFSERLQSGEFQSVQVNYKSHCSAPYRLQLSLSTRDGQAFGTYLDASEDWRQLNVDLNALKPVPLALLPRAYPIFQKNFRLADESTQTAAGTFSPRRLGGVQFVVRPEVKSSAEPFQPCTVWIGRLELH